MKLFTLFTSARTPVKRKCLLVPEKGGRGVILDWTTDNEERVYVDIPPSLMVNTGRMITSSGIELRDTSDIQRFFTPRIKHRFENALDDAQQERCLL